MMRSDERTYSGLSRGIELRVGGGKGRSKLTWEQVRGRYERMWDGGDPSSEKKGKKGGDSST